MKLLCNTTDYDKTIQLAKDLKGNYNSQVIFHSFWSGELSEKHLYSIKSCYYFNVYKNKHKIILWIENNIPNDYNKEIEKYAEIKQYSYNNEKIGTPLENYSRDFYSIPLYADLARTLLLYNYGGCWFDLDCFFLRSFDPIFCNFENEICVYQWEKQNYPNNAIYISLTPRSIKMENNIKFIMDRNRGWGFQEAQLTYDLPLELLVLPCSWFNGCWIENPYKFYSNMFFRNSNIDYNFNNFFTDAFCYHWHNKWNETIEENSPIKKLVKLFDINIDSL